MKIYIGIDNGVTGSIGVIDENGKIIHFLSTPTTTEKSYTKTKIRFITRINYPNLYYFFHKLKATYSLAKFICFIERPMINSGRFVASISAARALESTLVVLESCGIQYSYCDSKAWQKELLPDIKGRDELKEASKRIGERMYPSKLNYEDYDGLLIAEWARRNNL